MQIKKPPYKWLLFSLEIDDEFDFSLNEVVFVSKIKKEEYNAFNLLHSFTLLHIFKKFFETIDIFKMTIN